MKFRDVVGQNELKKLFVENITKGRVPHSQLFSGKTGYGTLALALSYVQYLYCNNRTPEGDSCGECNSCYKINNLQHPDLHFVFPTNKSIHSQYLTSSGDTVSDSLIGKFREQVRTKKGYFSDIDWYNTIEIGGKSKNVQANISRADATELIKKLSMKSFQGGYKTVIIWLPEKMNESAANTLLKLFEEPAEKTLFLFISEDTSLIIKTILSRTQIINIPPIDKNEINKFLIKNNITKEQGDCIIALKAQGDINKLHKILEYNEGEDENFEMFSSLMRKCYGVKHLELIEWAEGISALDRETQKNFLEYSIGLLRDSYIKTIGMNNITYSYGEVDNFLNKFHPFIHHKNIEILLKEFERTIFELSRNGNPKIIFIHMSLAISKLIVKP